MKLGIEKNVLIRRLSSDGVFRTGEMNPELKPADDDDGGPAAENSEPRDSHFLRQLKKITHPVGEVVDREMFQAIFSRRLSQPPRRLWIG